MNHINTNLFTVIAVSLLMTACASTPVQEPVSEPIQPVIEEQVSTIETEPEVAVIQKVVPAPISVPEVRVNFAFDSSEVKVSEQQKLLEIISYVREAKPTQLIIKGHADESGPESYNKVLSRKRAEAVKVQLESMGLGSIDVDITALGETQPAVSNVTREGRSQNRRVEFTPITTASIDQPE